MDLGKALRHARPAAMSEEEWRLRLELAACYRLFEVTLRRAGIRCEDLV